MRNSSRVLGSSRNTPSMVEVTVLLLIFCTPRITMHMCLWRRERGALDAVRRMRTRHVVASAQVYLHSLDDDGDTGGLHGLGHGDGDLLRETLLH